MAKKYTDDNGDIDYSALLSDAMSSGADASTVQGLLDKRVDKATGTPGLEQYAYDKTYGAAMDYINSQSKKPSYTAPSAPSGGGYSGSYSSQIDDLLDEILNRKDFTYDATKDPLYQQYSQQYQREGQRASENTLADVASQSGGMSSYAVTAANQAGNYYASKQADMIPQLYEAAYQKYLGEIDGKVRDLGLLNQMDATQYGRYRDTMSDWRADRDFSYGKYRDEVGDQRWDKEFDYNAGRDEINDGRYDKEQQYQKDRETALALANAGSFGALSQLWGLDEGQTQALIDDYAQQKSLTNGEAARNLADWYAQYGDFGKLKEQGVNVNLSALGGGSKGGNSGGGKDGDKSSYSPKLTAAQARAAIEAGSRSPSVLADYEYWYGEQYQEQYSTKNAASEGQFNGYRQNLMGYRTDNGRAVKIQELIDGGKISEAQAVELFNYFKIPLE